MIHVSNAWKRFEETGNIFDYIKYVSSKEQEVSLEKKTANEGNVTYEVCAGYMADGSGDSVIG